ncbi:MAG: hypothetical protein ACQKHC_00390 [Candidatus Phytoplasma pruni]
MEINNLIESKIFISLISLFFGIFVYWFYLYIKHLQEKYDFSDELREVVNHMKNGKINLREYGALIRIMAQMGNYLGIYREHVQRMIKEFDENGGLNFAEGVFDEKENNADNKEKTLNNNDTELLLKENLRLKQQLNNIKTPLIIENNENDF